MMTDPKYLRYDHSEKGRASREAYRQTPNRQEALTRYAGSEKQKATMAKASAKRSAKLVAHRIEHPVPPPIGRTESRRKWDAANRVERSDAALRRRYGLTQAEVDVLKARTGCAICGRDDVRLVTDHKHEPHQIRDRLCRYCNIMIGVLEHSNFPKAVEYLKHWDAMLPG